MNQNIHHLTNYPTETVRLSHRFAFFSSFSLMRHAENLSLFYAYVNFYWQTGHANEKKALHKIASVTVLMCWQCRSSPFTVIYPLITYIIWYMGFRCVCVCLWMCGLPVQFILFIIFIGSKISIGRIIILACLFHNFNAEEWNQCTVQQTYRMYERAKRQKKWKQRSRRFMKRARKPQQQQKCLLNV